MSEVAATDGVRLYAEAHGDGSPLLLSCALCTTRENWRGQVAPLVSAGHRVILWDYRGHGRSEAPEDPAAYTMEQVVSDLGRVIDWAAPDDPVVLAGLSFGGLASLHYTLGRPERVRALALVGSGPGFKNPKAQGGWEKAIDRTASFILERGMQAFVEKAGVTTVGGRPELSAARAAARAIEVQDPRGIALFARNVAAPAPPVIDRLGEIEAPTLILVGERDDDYQRAAEVMAARLPNAKREALAGAGHIANIEQPEAFDAALLRFLAGLP